MSEIKIDPEFRSMIPPLDPDVRSELERQIIQDGCRDALVIWAEENLLLDGHNRYEICTRLNLPFKTTRISLPDRDAAADWIDSNQIARRNLKPGQIRLLIGRRYKRAKKWIGGRGPEKTDQNDPFFGHTTAQRLAKEHGVAEITVRRAAAFAGAVERLKEVDPDIEQKVLAGTAPSRKRIMQAAEASLRNNNEARRILNAKPETNRKNERNDGKKCRSLDVAMRLIEEIHEMCEGGLAILPFLRLKKNVDQLRELIRSAYVIR